MSILVILCVTQRRTLFCISLWKAKSIVKKIQEEGEHLGQWYKKASVKLFRVAVNNTLVINTIAGMISNNQKLVTALQEDIHNANIKKVIFNSPIPLAQGTWNQQLNAQK